MKTTNNHRFLVVIYFCLVGFVRFFLNLHVKLPLEVLAFKALISNTSWQNHFTMTEMASQELRHLYSQFISESGYKAIIKEHVCVK